jgi:hypothetical protein
MLGISGLTQEEGGFLGSDLLRSFQTPFVAVVFQQAVAEKRGFGEVDVSLLEG